MSLKPIAIPPKKRKTSEITDLANDKKKADPPIDLLEYKDHRVLVYVESDNLYRRGVIDGVLDKHHLRIRLDNEAAEIVVRDVLDHERAVIGDTSPTAAAVSLKVEVAVLSDNRNEFTRGRVVEKLEKPPIMYRVQRACGDEYKWVRRMNLRLLRAPWYEDLADALTVQIHAAAAVAVASIPHVTGSSHYVDIARSARSNEQSCEQEIARITQRASTPPQSRIVAAAASITPLVAVAPAFGRSPIQPVGVMSDWPAFLTPDSGCTTPTSSRSTKESNATTTSSSCKESPLVSSLSRCVSVQSVESMASSSASQSPSLLYLMRDGVTMAPGTTPKYKKGDVVCTPKGLRIRR